MERPGSKPGRSSFRPFVSEGKDAALSILRAVHDRCLRICDVARTIAGASKEGSTVKYALIALATLVIAAAMVFWPEGRAAPEEAFAAYREAVLSGRTFEEDLGYYSAERQAEMEQQVADRGIDGERLMTIYLRETQKAESCSAPQLRESEVEGDTARLVYTVNDTCRSYGDEDRVLRRLSMVWEDGWKIESDETVIGE